MDEYEVHLPFGFLFVVATAARSMEGIIRAPRNDQPLERALYNNFLLLRGWMAA